jgi:methylmalonyl-CoA/ethylmalonyl-CoA epimerase
MAAARVDHTAIVVGDIDEAVSRWIAVTGATIVSRQIVPRQRVEVAMLRIGDTRIELISPLDSDSGVARFLAKRGESLHHVGLEVADIRASMVELAAAGAVFTDPEPRPGIDGEVAFLKPESSGGVLVELVQIRPAEEE